MADGLPPYTVAEAHSHYEYNNKSYSYTPTTGHYNYNYAYAYPGDPYAYAYTYPPPAPPTRTSSLRANPQTAQRPLSHSQSPSSTSPRYSSTAEAIAQFRPTPREVISGIAPHVFDERRRRRQAHAHGYGHRKTQSAAAGYGQGHGDLTGVGAYGGSGSGSGGYVHARRMSGSPLKGGAVLAWDERGVYVDDSPPPHHSDSGHGNRAGNGKDDDDGESPTPSDDSDKRKRKKGWRYLVRVDVRLFRSMVDKLRPSKGSSRGAEEKR